MQHELSWRVTGFVSALILTFAAYFIILNPSFIGSNINTAVIVLFVLALVQSLVQLIFFINVWNEKGPLWNLAVFASTATIIFIVIFFSIWIMDHLNYNMRM